MPITLNGSGTITGISVGGLPDGIVDTDMIAAGAVTAVKSSGRKILQVLTVVHTATVSTTGITYVDTGLSTSITPSSSSSKVLILVSQGYYITRSTDQARGGFRLLRNTGSGFSVIEQGPNAGSGTEPNGLGKSTNLGGVTQFAGRYNLHILDSPSTTNATTYKTQFANAQSSASPTIYVNSGTGSGEMGSGFMTLMEVTA